MTVNERLWVAGLLKQIESAIECKDEEKFRKICKDIYLDTDTTDVLVDKYFKG